MPSNNEQDNDKEPSFGDLAGLGLRLGEGSDSIPGAITLAAIGLGLAGVAYGGYQVKKHIDRRKTSRTLR